jgi:pSer/pThr/pTyr-binding forkhead associated (FHA) protein
LVVSDLGSANGTRVNGARIDRPTLLIDGDEIAVGTTTLCVATDLGGLRREATVMRPRPQRAHAA